VSPPRSAEPALVVVRSGPASERGWLGLRIALALALDGGEVTVWLCGDGAGWALPLDVRAWLGGDPGRDLDGLVDDAGATVLVDAASLAAAGAGAESCRRGVAVAGPEEFVRRCGATRRVLAV
jgi:predicted peroxiredoxin